jgi:3-methylcrotonyl-CoA carboxylase alpha subunit
MKSFRKILIANRGEIAARIIRTAKKMQIDTVLVHSVHDKETQAWSLADETYLLEGESLAETYLNTDAIVQAALKTGCEAIHPGYGFLSENAEFAETCKQNNLVFIGPEPDVIRLMGNKLAARNFAKEAGVPILEGYSGSPGEILEHTKNPEFPLLVKAAAGGGGKGMKIVTKPDEFKQALESAQREAENYFGNGELYVERFISKPRHIEVQVLGDHHGQLIHLFERECTIQRRYQKIIEECPSPTLTETARREITHAAVSLGKKANYKNAGTIEFLLDENGKYFFLEMNTRIQVEHPVTEMATGIDLVEQQIRIASGQPLSFSQEEVSLNGHALECRIYAEDPWNNFLPAPGKMTLYQEPVIRNVRIDAAFSRPATVQGFYDPMIAKLIVHRPNRHEAINTMISALGEYPIHGIKTNTGYLRTLLDQPAFRANQVYTKFCEDKAKELFDFQIKEVSSEQRFIPMLGYLLAGMNKRNNGGSIWEQIGFWRVINEIEVWLDCQTYLVRIEKITEKEFYFSTSDKNFSGVYTISGQCVVIRMNNQVYKVFLSEKEDGLPDVSFNGNFYPMFRRDFLRRNEFSSDSSPDEHPASSHVRSPMPGKVVKVAVKPGKKVEKGDLLFIIEAMKMENNVLSPMDGTVWEVPVKQGDMVDSSSPLLYFEDIRESEKIT